MDLQALRYFRIVAREGSFSQAAQKLNYAQSNLSTKIRQLEGELETPLFRRHAHGVTLTEKGESLLAYADRLVNDSLTTGETITVTTGLLPGFGVDDVVSLRYGETFDICVERGWTMELRVGGKMSHILEKVVLNLG